MSKAPVARCSAAVRRTSRKTSVRSTVWSAGRTTMTSSSGRSMARVASAMAAAVFRPSGSTTSAARGDLLADESLVAPVGDDRDVVGQARRAARPCPGAATVRRAAAGRASGARVGSGGGGGCRRRRPGSRRTCAPSLGAASARRRSRRRRAGSREGASTKRAIDSDSTPATMRDSHPAWPLTLDSGARTMQRTCRPATATARTTPSTSSPEDTR